MDARQREAEEDGDTKRPDVHEGERAKERSKEIEQEIQTLDRTEELEEVEQEFQEVLQGLVGDATLEKFRGEYERLHNALRQSHANEKKLVQKVRDLNNELASMGAKVAHAMKLSEDDDTMVSKLRKQIDSLYQSLDQTTHREKEANKTIEKLQHEISSMTEVVNRYTSLIGEDTTLEEIIEARDNYAQKHEEALEALKAEQEKVDNLTAENESLKMKNREKKATMGEVKNQVKAKQDELLREQKKREAAEQQIAQMRSDLQERTKQLDELQNAFMESEKESKNRLDAVSEAKSQLKEQMLEFHEAQESIKRLTQQLTEMERRHDSVAEAKNKAEKELHQVRQEKNKAESRIRGLERNNKSLESRVERLRKSLDEQKLEYQQLENEYKTQAQTLQAQSKETQKKEKEMSKTQKEMEKQGEKLSKEEQKKQEKEAELTQEKKRIQELELENQTLRKNAEKSRNVIDKMTLHARQLKLDLQKQKDQNEELQSQLQMKESQIAETEKKETELLSRLKHQQSLYESVRSDRNMYSKQLIESQDEISEMKRKFKVMTHQIEQLKDDIANKDRALVAEHFEKKSVSKMLQQRTHENEELKKLLNDSDNNAAQLGKELDQLNAAIRKQDEEARHQKRKLGDLVTERDILGTQLIRRNDELALLREKIDIMQSTLKKGEAQYKEKVDYIRMLKTKLADVRRELAIANSNAGKMTEMQREINRLQKELLQEKTKVKALSEELENPMNVHRWRKLEGSDPATYELIQKVQTLQKRLIHKTEEAVEKDLLLQEKQKLYAELKNILARQPGPEVAEKLSKYQQMLGEKTRQMKAMASELNMSQANANEYHHESQRLHAELQDLKKRYYELKKRSTGGGLASSQDKQNTSDGDPNDPESLAQKLAAEQKSKNMSSAPRFTGGGFNVEM